MKQKTGYKQTNNSSTDNLRTIVTLDKKKCLKVLCKSMVNSLHFIYKNARAAVCRCFTKFT